MSIYEIKVKDNKQQEKSLADFRDRVLLIVNTATGCGFTPQYKGLQELYDKYHDYGLEILDFPSNQFANQAPGDDEDINQFCTLNYGTTFPRFAKIDVNGPKESSLFRYLKKSKNGMLGSSIKWNFTKFLVDRQGNVVGRYAPAVKPEELESDIRKLLGPLI